MQMVEAPFEMPGVACSNMCLEVCKYPRLSFRGLRRVVSRECGLYGLSGLHSHECRGYELEPGLLTARGCPFATGHACTLH